MIHSFKHRQVMQISYRVYYIFLWIQYLLLGKDLYLTQSLNDALNILHGNSLFMIRVIQSYLATTKGWIEFFVLIFNEISIAAIILIILFYIYTDQYMIYISILVPMIGLICILWSLRSQTFLEGVGRINMIGMMSMVVASIIILYNFLQLLKEIVFVE